MHGRGRGATTRIWDLAYSAQAFTLNDAGEDPAVSAPRLAALVDDYGAWPALRSALPEVMARRTEAMWTMLRDAHEQGRAAADHVARHREVWAQALRR